MISRRARRKARLAKLQKRYSGLNKEFEAVVEKIAAIAELSLDGMARMTSCAVNLWWLANRNGLVRKPTILGDASVRWKNLSTKRKIYVVDITDDNLWIPNKPKSALHKLAEAGL